MQDIDKIIRRMVQATGAKNMAQMLETMEFSNSTGSTWRRRKKIPDGSIAKVAELADVSFEWLKSGNGPMRQEAGRIAGAEHLDADLARMVIAEVQAEYGSQTIELTPQEITRALMIRTLPEEARQRVDHLIQSIWLAEQANRSE